ncbi:unnamed protein product [Cochlearia groenlandica]
MGCGGSRLGGEARPNEGGVVPLPAGIRPLLRRRLEEMKKRSHASVLKGKQTLSKKELLKHGSSEDGEETEENDDDNLKLSAKVAPTPDHQNMEEKKEVIYEKISPKNDVKQEEEVVKKQEVENIDKANNDKKEENDGTNNNNNDDKNINVKKEKKEDDHEETILKDLEERMICYGSPSFRVYCVDIPSDDDQEEKDEENTKKSVETESVIIIPIKEEENIIKSEKKTRKGKRFGIALPKKYLANVTAPCYAGRGCMGNNNNTHSRLVQEKSSQ